MAFFLFGRRKSKSRKTVKKGKKPPAAVLRKCRKLKIKTTKKVGSKRVYRKLSLLRKLIKKKTKKSKRSKRSRKVHRRKSSFGRIKSRFQFGSAAEFTNAGPSNYGYNQKAMQKPGILNQSSQIVFDQAANDARPPNMRVPSDTKLPIYGVARPFFVDDVPTQVAPEWTGMGQPDGSIYNIGGPFVGYSKPASYGRRRRSTRRRRMVY
jgi:hypothetical protein